MDSSIEQSSSSKSETEIVNGKETENGNIDEQENKSEQNVLDLVEKCEQEKLDANELFKKHSYLKAIEKYSWAIDNFPIKNEIPAAYYSNRSFAHLKNDCPAAALIDANLGITTDKNFIKNYYRRASANMLLQNLDEALKDFEYVYKRKPKDKDAKDKVFACRKIVKEKKFLRAISCGSGMNSSGDAAVDFMAYDLEKLRINTEYNGPRLDNIETDLTPKFLSDLKVFLKNQKILPKKYLYKILQTCMNKFKSYNSLVDIKIPDKVPFTICGDTHGQFYDLCHIFELNGEPGPQNPYLFNGDFVDRGSYSIEVILTLLAYKALYPDHFHLTRGNHETINMNELYGFEGETKHKYDTETFKFFTAVFNWLPLAYCISSSADKKIVIMHGGLFDKHNDKTVTLQNIRDIDRNRQPGEAGLMTDILWSDPSDIPGRSPSKRGTSIQFGPDITKEFCDENKLEYIVRSHEVKNDGYEGTHNNKCYTIFSAPNYCDQMGNEGAYLKIYGPDLKPEFHKFKCVKHPNVKSMQYSGMNMMRLAGLFN